MLATSYRSVTISLEILCRADVTNDTLLSHRAAAHIADHCVPAFVIRR